MVSGDFDQYFYDTINSLYDEVKNEDMDINDEIQVKLNTKITRKEILNAIKSTNMNKTTLDNFNMHPKMLSNLGEPALKLMEKLFNLVFQTGKWVWNTASVIFLRKSGKKSYRIPGAYRPICITSYVGKLLEKIIASRLNAFLLLINYHDPTQEGFTAKRNTIRYLNRLHLEIKADLMQNMTVIALFADMEKAFDSVWKKGLIVKLAKLNIKGNILKLIDDFLFSRIVKLNINSYEGGYKHCEEYGLPQGSALSPVLFKIYMLDLLEDLQSNSAVSIYKFADDGTVKIRADSNHECVEILKLVTVKLYKWSTKWRMIINCDPNKTEYICFGSKKFGYPIPDTVAIGNKEIKRVQSTKVLGLIYDEKLSFKEHSEDVNNRLIGKWAQICQYSNTQWGFNQRVLTRIIQTVFIAILQYAGHIWLNSKTFEVIEKIWYKLLKSAVGATFNIKLETAETILGLPPLNLQTKVNSVKHYLKINIVKMPEDKLRDSLNTCLNSNSPLKEAQDKIKEVFRFLKWKGISSPQDFNENDNDILSRNDITRYHELSSSCCKYTKGNIKKYTEKLWAASSRNKQLMTGELAISIPSCSPLPIPTQTDRREEVLLMSLFYPNNLMNSFVYRHTYNAESPLCRRCKAKEETPYHIIMECNSQLEKMQSITSKLLGQTAASIDHCNTLINCSRNPEFIQCSLEILKGEDFPSKIDGIIPA